MEVLTAENGTRARIAALGIIHLDYSSALMDGCEAATGSKCFQVLEGCELVRGVPKVAAFAFGESGASRNGVLNVPAVAPVDERHLIIRYGRHDQKIMAIFNFRHDNVIQLQLTSNRQTASFCFLFCALIRRLIA
jgi:hypothetical protein